MNGKLVTKRRYETSQKKIESELGLVQLVSDVRHCISQVDGMFEDKSYLDVLGIIEQGAYEIRRESSFIIDRIDLSEAHLLIHGYRNGSEGGCTACQSLCDIKPCQDDTIYWCGVDETEEKALQNWKTTDKGMTFKTRKYWENGCEARKPKFNRKVEEVLADAEEHGLAALTKEK